jgi:hypothetical protein
MDVLVTTVLMPPEPYHGYPRTARLASRVLVMRSIWLRFPPRFFFLDSVIKAVPWLRRSVQARVPA